MRSLTRQWSAVSNAEEGNDAAADQAQQAISEEIDEIKRYEVRHNGLRICGLGTDIDVLRTLRP